uniref:Uncharacterized protein n=1 Tax=Anguilla anguilla TaxID=7936 RepID=A0A0E9PVC5_ANGAN
MSIFIDARGKPHAFLVLSICVHSRHVPIPNDESLSTLSLCKGYINDPDIQATVQNNQVFTECRGVMGNQLACVASLAAGFID